MLGLRETTCGARNLSLVRVDLAQYSPSGVRTDLRQYPVYNGTRSLLVASLLTAQKKFGVDFVFLSKSYQPRVGLTKFLPAGPYFLESASFSKVSTAICIPNDGH